MVGNLRRSFRRARAWFGKPKIIYQDRLVQLDANERCEDPIFLVGVHRSGTSLLRRVINSHPNIACPAESFFLEHYVRMLEDRHVADGYRSFGNDPEMMRCDIAKKASSLHEAYRIAQDKPRWADKTPQYTKILSGLQTLFGDGCRFLMIYRHPFDTVASLIERGWDLSGDGAFNLAATLEHLGREYRNQIDFEKSNPDICVRVKYEDLVLQPEMTLRKLMPLLGEAFSDRQLRHHEQEHGFGTEDPIARGLTGFQPSIGNWQALDASSLDQIKRGLSNICQELGYPTEVEANP